MKLASCCVDLLYDDIVHGPDIDILSATGINSTGFSLTWAGKSAISSRPYAELSWLHKAICRPATHGPAPPPRQVVSHSRVRWVLGDTEYLSRYHGNGATASLTVFDSSSDTDDGSSPAHGCQGGSQHQHDSSDSGFPVNTCQFSTGPCGSSCPLVETTA